MGNKKVWCQYDGFCRLSPCRWCWCLRRERIAAPGKGGGWRGKGKEGCLWDLWLGQGERRRRAVRGMSIETWVWRFLSHTGANFHLDNTQTNTQTNTLSRCAGLVSLPTRLNWCKQWLHVQKRQLQDEKHAMGERSVIAHITPSSFKCCRHCVLK